MLQLSLPLHEVIAIQSGGKTHIPFLVQEGDVYEALPDDAARIMSRDGICRAFTQDTVILRDSTTKQHTIEVSVAQINPTPLALTEMHRNQAVLFGCATLCDLWHGWTQRHDPTAHHWWNASRELFQPHLEEQGFRKFLRTRYAFLYTAWILVVTPIPSAEATASLTALIQSLRSS